MPSTRYKSLTEQVAQRIRDRILDGRLSDVMPGRQKLSAELGVNHKTCEAALRLLEGEGILVPQGKGRGRAIIKSAALKTSSSVMQVKLLLYERSDLRSHFLVELLHRLREVGHEASFAEKTMKGLGMNMGRITRYVEHTKADAWIVLAGPHDLLQWFSEQSFPAFALFGRMRNTPIPSIIPNKMAAMEELVTRLASMGHQRIVLITREDRRKPNPGASEKSFLESLEENGISTSSYNLPDWGDSPDELEKLLGSLYRYTPPTAIITSEAPLFFATMQWLSRVGLHAPDNISLACMDPSSAFDWCRPEITHINWGTKALVNRIVQWVGNISAGKEDMRKTTINAKLHIGGTIGPAVK